MYYLFYGSDADKARARARTVLDALRKKRAEAEYFRLTADNWSQAAFEEYLSGQGLFERKFIVFLDRCFERADAKEAIAEAAKRMAESDNAFVVLEDKIDAKTAGKLEKAAEKKEKFDKEIKKVRTDFNVFSLADALASRDRKRLWVLYEEALMNEISPEEINGVLFWQVKTLLQARSGGSAKEAGLAPFAFMKAKQNETKFSEEELQKLSRSLVEVYHETRRGRHDFETALESILLTV